MKHVCKTFQRNSHQSTATVPQYTQNPTGLCKPGPCISWLVLCETNISSVQRIFSHMYCIV